MGETPTRYLSTPQAAALLGLSPRTLESYRVKGGGPPFLSYCNRVHYLQSDLDAWAIAGRRRSTADVGGGAGTRDGRRMRDAGVARANGTGGTGRGRKASPRMEESPTGVAPSGTAVAAASDCLSVRELAALLQISRRTLDRYRARGAGPAFEKVEGRIVYARAGVETWLVSSRRLSIPDNSDDAPGSAPEPEGDKGDADPGSGEGAG